MKPASAELLALLRTPNFMIADLYRFSLASGAEDFFTSLDMPVNDGAHTYTANSLRVEGLKYKVAVGMEVDEQDIKIMALPTDQLAGADFLAGCAQGLLDGATILRSRGFWQRNTGIAALDYQQLPIGVVDLFMGRVSTITKIGRTQVELKVKSPLVLLNMDIPRNFYSTGCSHTLYDAGCTLVKSSFGINFTVISATTTTVVVSSISPATGGDSLPYFAQGRMLFTSGGNNGEQFLVSNNDGATFYMSYPFTDVPSPGDTFTAYPGCSKTKDTCDLKFANLENFRGFPFVPPVFISV